MGRSKPQRGTWLKRQHTCDLDISIESRRPPGPIARPGYPRRAADGAMMRTHHSPCSLLVTWVFLAVGEVQRAARHVEVDHSVSAVFDFPPVRQPVAKALIQRVKEVRGQIYQ